MKKVFCIAVALTLFTVSFLFTANAEEECKHLNRYATGVYHHEYSHFIGNSHWHTVKEYYQCRDCPYNAPMATSETTTSLESCTLRDNVTVLSHGKDSSQHWDICNVTTSCTNCSNSSSQTNVIRNRENHIEGEAVDAGHSGSVHYFERYCDKSFCKQFMVRFSVPCAGGNGHVTIKSVGGSLQ